MTRTRPEAQGRECSPDGDSATALHRPQGTVRGAAVTVLTNVFTALMSPFPALKTDMGEILGAAVSGKSVVPDKPSAAAPTVNSDLFVTKASKYEKVCQGSHEVSPDLNQLREGKVNFFKIS